MHFVGMEAMIVEATMLYDFWLFVGSICIAHILATIALYVRVLLKTGEGKGVSLRVLSACVMGCAVSGMHYTGMAAVTYYVSRDTVLIHNMQSSQSLVFALLIFLTIIIFSGITVIGTLVDKRLQEAKNNLFIHSVRKHTVVETLADALIIIDHKGKIETFNSAVAKMFVYSRKTIVGKKAEFLIPSVNYQDLLDESQKVGALNKSKEIEGVRSNGEKFPLEVSFSRMEINSKVMFTAVIRDISERKKLEEQLRQSQKMESIGQLAAGIAHEINTPTQYISDNTSFLKKAFVGILNALDMAQNIADKGIGNINVDDLTDLRKSLKKAKIKFVSVEIPKAIDQSLDGLQRVATIVSAMKSFSHPNDGEKQNIDLAEAIQATVTVARNEWKYIAEMECDFDKNVPAVPCLRDEFNQVILNIIVNAAHAIESVSKIDNRKGKIHIKTSLQGDFAVVEISDNGQGMPSHVKQKIFDPFFTTKSVGKGTGQGLSIAYSVIVDKHYGTINVSSQEGQGTTFEIRLPLKIKTLDVEKVAS